MAGQTIPKPREDKRQRYVFYLGVLLATIAAIVAFVAVRNGGGGSGGNGDVAVVQAKEAIPAETVVTKDMLEVKFVSADDAKADAFTSRSQVIDRVATEDVEAGSQVLTSNVSDTTIFGISGKVEDGYRALSVEVKEVVSVGGNATPGDQVDVIGIFKVPDVEAANDLLKVLGVDYTALELPRPVPSASVAEGEQAAEEGSLYLTVTLLQDVKLLAMSQNLAKTSGSGNVADDLDEAETDPRAATATLQLKPQKAQETTWADELGILRLDVRHVGDEKIVDVVPALLRIEPLN